MSENKDALYREEFELMNISYDLSRNDKGNYINSSIHKMWKSYEAGRKKGEVIRDEQTTLLVNKLKEATNLIQNLQDKHGATEEEFRELYRKKDASVFDRDQEIESLKKEIEDLKKEHEKISCAYCGELCAREIDELISHVVKCEKHPVFKLTNENQKLRELVKGFCDGEFGIYTFKSKAEEVLK